VSDKQKTKFGVDDADRFGTLMSLGLAYYREGRHDDTDRLARAILEPHQKRNAESNETAHARAFLGMNLLAQKRFAEAEEALRASLATAEKNKQPEWRCLFLKNQLGAALAGQGKSSEAEPLLVDGYEQMRQREPQIPAPWKWYLTATGKNVV